MERRLLQVRTGGEMLPTQAPLAYPLPEEPWGRMQIEETVGTGAVLLVDDVVVLVLKVVAGQRLVAGEVVVAVVVEGGFLETQSGLLHFPPGQEEEQ